jgi:hypothetical protein
MTTYTQNLGINLIGTGEETDTWGDITNGNFYYGFEQAIVGRATVTFADADVTIVKNDDITANQTFRDLYLYCTGTNTAIRTLTLPSGIYKNYIIDNSISGSFGILVKTDGVGSTLTVPYGKRVVVYLNGLDVLQQETHMPSGISLGVPLALADGGTGATTAAAARTNLGLGTGATTNVGTMATQNSNNVAITGGSITGISALQIPEGGTGLSSFATGDTTYYAGGVSLSRLTIGAVNTIMTSTGLRPQWVSNLSTSQGGTGLASYTAGDINYYAAGTSMSKLAIGSANAVLTSTGTAPQWSSVLPIASGGTGVTGYSTGDTVFFASGTSLSRLPIGTAGQALVVGASPAPAWTTQYLSVTFIIDGGGTVLTTGVKGDITVPFNCTVDQWTLLADQSGSVVVSILKDPYASAPPTTNMVGSAPPTITSATKAQSASLTGWSAIITAGDVLRFSVSSVTSITRVTVSLRVYRT